MKNIRGICWDLFDTLVVFHPNIYKKYHTRIAGQFGIEPELFISAWKETNRPALDGEFSTLTQRCEAVLKLVHLPVEDHREKLEELELQSLRCSVRPVAGIERLLTQLHRRGLKMGIISNASCAGAAVLRLHDLERYFSVCLFSFTEKLWKPEPQVYLLACRRLGLQPESVAFIGDGDGGELDGASQTGLFPIRFDPTQQYQHLPIPLGIPDCRTVSELKQTLLLYSSIDHPET